MNIQVIATELTKLHKEWMKKITTPIEAMHTTRELTSYSFCLLIRYQLHKKF